MAETKSIYNLELHESMDIPPNLQVTKVPGGYIYRFWDYEKNEVSLYGTFVPSIYSSGFF
jgi:hypothetical protein